MKTAAPQPGRSPAGVDDDPLGILIHSARASTGIKLLCLMGGVGALVLAGVIWPEFSARFGGVRGWLLTLLHNPLFAMPGLMLFLSIGCGIWALWRLAYYMRLRVDVREYGIRVTPGSREAFWDDIEEIRYAQRRLRGSPMRESLQLRPRDQKPIGLAHRFKDMRELITAVRERLEPRLVEQALGAIECEGQASFGPLVTIERDRLILGLRHKELPLNQVGNCGVHGGQFSVTDLTGRLVFARAAEFIPNVTIIGPLVNRVSSAQP